MYNVLVRPDDYDLSGGVKEFAKELSGNWTHVCGNEWKDADQHEDSKKWGFVLLPARLCGTHPDSRPDYCDTVSFVNARTIYEELDRLDDIYSVDLDTTLTTFYFSNHVVMVCVYSRLGDTTPAVELLYSIALRLQSYQCLDDDFLDYLEAAEIQEAWEYGGREEFVEGLCEVGFPIGDAACSMVSIDFSYATEEQIDTFVNHYDLREEWYHNGNEARIDVDKMLVRASRISLDSVVNFFFADLEAYGCGRDGGLFRALEEEE